MRGKEYELAVRIAGVIDKSFNQSLAGATMTAKGFVKNLDTTFTQLDVYGNAAFRAMTTAATVAATAIGAVSAAAIKVGSDFEAQMSTVQAIAQASDEDLGKLSDKARKLAETSVFSATEIGQAMEYMGMAGWKTNQMLAGIEGVIDLAAASGEDLALVSDIVTDDLTAFNMTAEETQRMVDVMAQAAMNSNTNVAKMGETFKYAGAVAGAMGYQIEDVAIATGLMASAGVKESIAGTSLRNILTRMAKPTKESQEAMDRLGLSLEDDTGRMYSLLEIMERLRAQFQNTDDIEGAKAALASLGQLTDEQIEEVYSDLGDSMTKAEEAYYAAELGGQRGMTGLLAIANASDEEFQMLTEAIYNAEGAADQMANVRLDNLQGDVQILKDSLIDLGIELYEQESGPLRSIVQTATKIVQNLKDKVPDIGRKIAKFIVPVFEKIVSVGKWIVDHSNTIISVITGIAAAITAYKIMSTVTHIVNGIMSIMAMPFAPYILGIVAAIGLLVGVVTKLNAEHKKLVDESLDKHFGDLSLSLSELRSVAKGLVEDESLEHIEEALSQYEKLDSIGDSIADTAEALRKMNWQIEIGLGLSESDYENGTYQQYIDDYINNAQDYLTQAQYAANLNLLNYFDADSETMSELNQFFENNRDTLTTQAEDLRNAVNEAFTGEGEEALLSIDEEAEIVKLQTSMQNILNAVANSEFNAETALIKAKYGSLADLDSESFIALQDEVNDALEEYTEKQEEAYKKAYSALEAKGSSESEFEKLTNDYLNNIATKQGELAELMANTIADAYGIESQMNGMDAASKILLSDEDVEAILNGSEVQWNNVWSGIEAIVNEQADKAGLEYYDRDAIAELLEEMEPQQEELETLLEKYRELGNGIPSSVLDGINEYTKLKLMSGEYTEDDIWSYFGAMITESPNYQELLDALETNGSGIPDGLAQAIEDNLDKVDPAVTSLYNETQNALNTQFASGFDVNATVRLNLDATAQQRAEQFAMRGIDKNATGGIITSPEISWLAEKGPEAVVPLDGSRNAVSLWKKAGQLLGMSGALDRYDVSSPATANIEYRPTLQFYGEAPSKNDLTDALRVSQDEFDAMMDKYIKTNGRVSFA